MSTVEEQILLALKELDQSVKAMATASPKPNLLPLFARIDTLAGQLPRTADPELLHFLQRRSYEKALHRLEGQSVSRGNCGGRAG